MIFFFYKTYRFKTRIEQKNTTNNEDDQKFQKIYKNTINGDLYVEKIS